MLHVPLSKQGTASYTALILNKHSSHPLQYHTYSPDTPAVTVCLQKELHTLSVQQVMLKYHAFRVLWSKQKWKLGFFFLCFFFFLYEYPKEQIKSFDDLILSKMEFIWKEQQWWSLFFKLHWTDESMRTVEISQNPSSLSKKCSQSQFTEGYNTLIRTVSILWLYSGNTNAVHSIRPWLIQ